MATGGEDAVPVWGIEVGPDLLRAARVVRRDEGGFDLLDYQESHVEGPGPEALVGFLRRHRLRRHPLVIAIGSPTAHLSTVALPPEDISQNTEEMRLTVLEHVHPEPELIDIRWSRETENVFLVSAEERARVESFLVSLESAGAAAYALMSDHSAVLGVLRGLGLFEGDGLIVRVQPRSTDLLFLDGPSVRRFALPVGSEDLDDDEALEVFGQDVARLVDYHRSRVSRDDPERIVLLGVEGPAAERIGAQLPELPVHFPGDGGPVRGRGRIGTPRCLSILRTAPAAVGAAIAGAADPRPADLAFRPLPAVLPVPPEPARSWFAASALLWISLAVLWFGSHRELVRLRAAKEALASPQVSAGTTRKIRSLVPQARSMLALPSAIERVLRSIPGEELAPYRTERIEMKALEDGAFEARLAVVLLGPDHDPDSPRARALREQLKRLTRSSVEPEEAEGGTAYRIRIRVEGPR